MKEPTRGHKPEGRAKRSIYGVIAAGLALLVLAYAGVTFGLGDDKATVVTAVLTFDALLFGAVAAVVALAAYVQASGRPDMTVELMIDATKTDSDGLRMIRGPRIPNSSFRSFLPSVQTIYIEIRNGSQYSARNPGVKVKLFGIDGQQNSAGWSPIIPPSNGARRQFQWDGGSDLLVHGKWSRPLPPLLLTNLRLDTEAAKHEIAIEYVADGVDPQTRTIPINVLQSTLEQGTA